jgi:hypothetical protein
MNELQFRSMPVHDWTRVGAGIFHHFHHEWISSIASALNRGILPDGQYALAEQITGGLGPDIVAVGSPVPAPVSKPDAPARGIALLEAPPKVQFHGTGTYVPAVRNSGMSTRFSPTAVGFTNASGQKPP